MTRGALLIRLRELQQLPKFANRDICTVSAVLSRDALQKHVEHCEKVAGLDADQRPAAA